MGKLYRDDFNEIGSSRTSEFMRIFCQRPGKKNPDGSICYFTEQAHKDTCDVNKIIRKYDKTGLISHISKFEAMYGDMTGFDFKEMKQKVIDMTNKFNELPSDIRKKFENSPENLLRFMENPENRDEAISLGLIKKEWTPETDGLGEHVKDGENVVTTPEKEGEK